MRLPQLLLLVVLVFDLSCRSAKQHTEENANVLQDNLELDLSSEQRFLPHLGSKVVRYFGVINLHDHKMSLPLEIALIPRSKSGKFNHYFLQAKAYFSSYSNKEYLLAFDNYVVFDSNLGSWEFSKEDKFSEIEFLTGESRSEYIVGNLSLKGSSEYSYSVKLLDESDISAKAYLKQAIYPMRSEISGVYQANESCQELPRHLVLEVVRLPAKEAINDEDAASNLKILGAFNRNVKVNEPVSPMTPSRECNEANCQQQQFFESQLSLGRLSFFGNKGVECELLESDVVCGSCQFTPINSSSDDSEIAISRDFEDLKANAEQLNPEFNLPSGEYFGLLHHTRLKQWQIVRLNLSNETEVSESKLIESKEKGSKNSLVKGVVNYFFGLPSENSYLLEKFYLANEIKNSSLVTQVLIGEEDSIIEIKQNGTEQLLIEWFSRTHGYIGQAVLQTGRMLAIPKDISRPLVSLFDGTYKNNAANYAIELQQPVSGQAQFASLRGSSSAFLTANTENAVLGKKKAEFTHYDMYTGEIASHFKDLGWAVAHLNSDKPISVSAWVNLPATHQLHGTFTALNFKRIASSHKHK